MRVLVVGKGGREHALVWRLHQSPSVRQLFCTAGNPAIDALATPVACAPADIVKLAEFAAAHQIDLTVVGPEEPLASGIGDEFAARGLTLLGPSKAAARLEASKAFAKQIMATAAVPTAAFETFEDPAKARRFVIAQGGPLVVKADGLAGGKGVTVCERTEEALAAIDELMERRIFGAAGARLLIEERLVGQELSCFALCDGTRALALGSAQDHKALLENDRGPNTGGMGAYSPVPQFPASLEAQVMREVFEPTLAAMAALGCPFRGILFAGLMVVDGRPKVLEFNVRLGDPEAEVLMLRCEGDLALALLSAARGQLDPSHCSFSPKAAVAVVLTAPGYPGAYPKALPISGLERIEGPSALKVRLAAEQIRVKVFHAGTVMEDGRLVSVGGRVLVVSALAPKLEQARSAAYEAADMIDFPGKHLRRDIGIKALG
jgi:phosphoribosylamine--glycine ligase